MSKEKTIDKKGIKELSKIEKLKAQKLALEARIQLMENKEKESLRKKENRVKFLLGAFMLDNMTKEKEKFNELFHQFKKYLTRERDKEVVNSYFEAKQ